ncbi:uncharacterized protein LOC136080161 [Hydra vulgaris]|uniref:Uncharacterized protein LOC136080161 n=1 Tax=Hydra vulgaris TaxID=6087 RepID=A0ABM4BUK3_HYDVU
MMQMKREKEKNKKRFWVRKVYAERLQKGEFHLLVQNLRLHDQEYFFKYFRMSPTTYEEFLSFVAPVIVKQRTTMRDPVSPSERLAVTLRFLVTGDAQCTIAASYRISASTISRIISEMCAAIWSSLKERNYLHVPSEKQEWKTIAKEFENMRNFPHAIGAIDGKHIVMQALHYSGSEYFNYKKTHCIVLLAVCNDKYEFTMVDIGDSGRQSDGSVFNNCSLGYAIENNKLSIPDPEKIGKSDKILPLSRARRVLENTFGIATSRSPIFRRPIIVNLEKLILITQAIVALHNFLMKKRSANNYLYCPTNYTDIDGPAGFRPGVWRQDNSCSAALQPLSLGSKNYSKDAKQVRDDFKEYFNSPEGELEWQLNLVNRKS